jgi:hypothetical protein
MIRDNYASKVEQMRQRPLSTTKETEAEKSIDKPAVLILGGLVLRKVRPQRMNHEAVSTALIKPLDIELS